MANPSYEGEARMATPSHEGEARMATPSVNLPPNLKVLAEMLQSGSAHPPIEGLLTELAFVADRIPNGDLEAFAKDPAPTTQMLALGLVGSFAASGVLGVTVSGPGGSALELCPVPGCGKQRTKT